MIDGSVDFNYDVLDGEFEKLTDIQIAGDMLAMIMAFIGKGRTSSDRGFRFNVVWYELRPSETGFKNLEHLSQCSGKGLNRANAHKVSKEWRDLTRSRSVSRHHNKSAAKRLNQEMPPPDTPSH